MENWKNFLMLNSCFRGQRHCRSVATRKNIHQRIRFVPFCRLQKAALILAGTDYGAFTFEMTYVINANRKSDFEATIKRNSYSVLVEVVFNIITDKNVITRCKCRAKCYRDNSVSQIMWKDEESMVFFYGHSIANADQIKVAGEK